MILRLNDPLGALFKRQASDGERSEERKERADTIYSTPLMFASPLNQSCTGFVVFRAIVSTNNLFLTGTKKAGVGSTSLKVSSLTPEKVKFNPLNKRGNATPKKIERGSNG